MPFHLPRVSSSLAASFVVLVAAACGGTAPGTNHPQPALDPLAFVPGDAVGIVHLDLRVFRESTELVALLEREGPEAVTDPVIRRCESVLIGLLDSGDDYAVVVSCPGLSSTEFDGVFSASFGPSHGFVLVAPGLAVRPAGSATTPVPSPDTPATRALRTRRAGSRDLASLVFVPSDAQRAEFVASSDEPGARAILEALADSFLGAEAWLEADGSRIRAHFVGSTNDVVAARMLAAILESFREPGAPDEAADSDEALARSFFAMFEVRVDGTSVVGDATIDDVAGFVGVFVEASRAERARRDEETVRSALAALPAPSAGDEANAALARFDYSAVIASIEPRRASLRADVEVEDARLLLALSDAYTATGRTEEALAIYAWADANGLASGNAPVASVQWRVRRVAARARSTRGDFVGAVAELDRALAIALESGAPDDVIRTTRHERSMALAAAGRIDDALVEVAAAVTDASIAQLSPERALEATDEVYRLWIGVQNNLAWSDFLVGRHAEGLARMESVFRAFESRPVPGGSHGAYENTLGCLLLGSGRFEEASAAFQRELVLRGRTTHENDPRRANAWVLLATSELRLHHVDKAIQYARRGLAALERTRTDRHPETALARLRLAQALRESGDAAGSRTEAQRAVEAFRGGVEPTHPDRREAEAFLAAAR